MLLLIFFMLLWPVSSHSRLYCTPLYCTLLYSIHLRRDEYTRHLTKKVDEKKSKRSFMADDGTKFAWDEERGDWKQVEGDEEEELEEDEEEVMGNK